MREEAEGWHSIGDKYCCSGCFADYAIKEFILGHLDAKHCDYCGRTSDERIAVHMDELLSFISAGLHQEYESPIHSVAWDSSEGGWQLPVMDTWDLLQRVGLECNETLFEDITNGFSDMEWVQRDPYGMTEDEVLETVWQNFCVQIKHYSRFVFFKAHLDDNLEDATGFKEPSDILDMLGKLLYDHGMLTRIRSGIHLIRARQHSKSDNLSEPDDFGPPPVEKAGQSRMSPSGIPMFYCADSEFTAFAETFDPKMTANSAVSFGMFRTKKPLVIVDLSEPPFLPSIFDQEQCKERMAIFFLHSFINDVRKPIVQDNRVHYEYIPTQVVTEYIRYVLRDDRGQAIDGIKYASSRYQNGICYVLFPQKKVYGQTSGWLENTLELVSARKTEMNEDSQPQIEYQGIAEGWDEFKLSKEMIHLSRPFMHINIKLKDKIGD